MIRVPYIIFAALLLALLLGSFLNAGPEPSPQIGRYQVECAGGDTFWVGCYVLDTVTGTGRWETK